jgi:tripartite-type tricarboxylate transporter receptor subunit TctC
VREFIALAKANPGKLTYGTSGASPHLAMELFKTITNIDVTSVTYKGAAPALADMMGGQITASLTNLPGLVAHAQAGRIRVLGVMDVRRAKQLPDVPTMAEAGVNDCVVTSWYGVCAPVATPKPVLDRLHTDFTGVLKSADIRQRFGDLVIDIAAGSPAEFMNFMRTETTRWAQVAKKAGLQPQ